MDGRHDVGLHNHIRYLLRHEGIKVINKINEADMDQHFLLMITFSHLNVSVFSDLMHTCTGVFSACM